MKEAYCIIYKPLSMIKTKPLSNEYKCKVVQEKIVEYLGIRFGDNPNVRECELQDFMMWIGRQVSYEDEQIDEKHKVRIKRNRITNKYLSLSK